MAKKPWEDRTGETGKMYEVKVMGTPTVSPEFFAAAEKLPWERNPEVKLNKLLDLYGKYAVDDPESPPGSHLNDVREAVLDAMGLRPEEYGDLKAYSTVGVAPIDFGMGVDGYVEYKDLKSGKVARVTLDATLNKRKAAESEDIKADLIIGELPDAKQEEDEYLEAIGRLGGEIASRLIKRSGPSRKAA